MQRKNKIDDIDTTAINFLEEKLSKACVNAMSHDKANDKLSKTIIPDFRKVGLVLPSTPPINDEKYEISFSSKYKCAATITPV